MTATHLIILLCLARPHDRIDRTQAAALDEGAIEVSGDERNHEGATK